MLDTNVNRPDFAWLNESSRIFLHRGYLLEGTEPEDRIRYIADHAEKLLNYPGFADKFYHYMARGYYSLASPIWSNFGLDRGLPISCVTGDTWINTKSGGKQAKDIVVGDMVLTHKNRYRPVTKVIPTKDKGDIYRLKVSLEIDELYITGNHPVLTQEGWVKVEDLDINKHLVAVNNEILKNDKYHVIDENVSVANDGIEYYSILSLDKTDKVEDVYDFTVEEDHSFSCAGVIVHNCFGSFIGDSIYDIMSTTAEVGMMSKTGGGTSGYFGAIRPRGAPIKDNGHSDGSFNFAKLFDTVIDVISQGTSRKGQFAGYIDIEHPDIEEWLDIHKEGNPIQLMYYGVCIGDQWLQEMKDGDAEKRRIWAKVLQRKAESGIPYLFFKDNVNNQKPDVYKDKDMTIYASNLCSEIALPSSLEESFVCCLSSMNALYFDEWKDTDAVETMTYFLDAVMEEFIQKSKSIPMMEKAHRFASRHRAIGIGVLGWHSYLQHKHIAFESFQAMQLNNELFKFIRDKSQSASKEMAVRYGEPEILKGYGRRNTTLTCVRGDTKVLTDRGNIPIIELIGKKTTIWNGYEWSEVTPFETGKKKLYRVTFSDGKYLDCTSDHIFKVVSVKIDRTEEMNGRRVLDVPLDKLRVGDVISKYKLPIIDGDMEFEDAYTQGFFTGDGSILHADRKNPEKEIRLYGSKMVCKDRIKWIKVRDCNYNGRELIRGKISSDYCDKYTVPNGYCTLKSKLDWLAGILDSDGSSTSCGMEISTAREDFAQNIVEMLSTLGCQSRMSRITRKPNQGYPGSSPYYWIVTISFQSCTILYDLGLRTERVKIPVGPCGYSSAPQYGWRTVKSIVDLGVEEMTYCFTEPKRNTGVFNGVMTGQCVAPTKSSSFILGGVSPSVEPIRSNYYIKDLAKIKTTYRNPLLTKVLQEKGLDNEATWQSILVNDGSVQHLEGLSDEDKAVFKTWQEISQLTIIQQAAQRQKYIDQGQSINILVHPDTPTKDINQLYLTAHELGMKSIYYQFSMSAAQKFNRALLNTCTTCES